MLFAGGIGITPIMAMVQTLKQQGRVMQLHYAGRSLNEMAFHQQLQAEMGDALTLYSSADQQRLDIERILSTASEDAMFYICGPARLLDAVVDTANRLKIDPQRIRFERFTAAPIADAKPTQLTLSRSGAVKVLDGEPDHRDSALSVVEREQGRLICPCVSRASSEYLVLDI